MVQFLVQDAGSHVRHAADAYTLHSHMGSSDCFWNRGHTNRVRTCDAGKSYLCRGFEIRTGEHHVNTLLKIKSDMLRGFQSPRDYFWPINSEEVRTSGLVQNPGW